MDAALIFSFVIGLITSGLIVVWYDKNTAPDLEVILDETGAARGQRPEDPPHAFYHLIVRNKLACRPFDARRPAWSCKATLEVLNDKGNPLLGEPIIVRWTSQPEPLLPVVDRGNIWNVIDPARLMAARKIDVYSHEDQPFSVALKFEGSDDCHLFSNESYGHPKWQNPAWCLSRGDHHLRITVYYERGRTIADFRLRNRGSSLSNLDLIPWGQ